MQFATTRILELHFSPSTYFMECSINCGSFKNRSAVLPKNLFYGTPLWKVITDPLTPPDGDRASSSARARRGRWGTRPPRPRTGTRTRRCCTLEWNQILIKTMYITCLKLLFFVEWVSFPVWFENRKLYSCKGNITPSSLVRGQ